MAAERERVRGKGGEMRGLCQGVRGCQASGAGWTLESVECRVWGTGAQGAQGCGVLLREAEGGEGHLAMPGHGGDLPGHLGGTAGRVEGAREVAAADAPHHVEREAHEREDEEDHHHGAAMGTCHALLPLTPSPRSNSNARNARLACLREYPKGRAVEEL